MPELLSHPADAAPARWLTIDEACDLANVTRRTLYNWLAKGRLHVYRTAGGNLRIDPESLFTPEKGRGES